MLGSRDVAGEKHSMSQLSDHRSKEKKYQHQHEYDGINRQDGRQLMSEDRESARPKLGTMQAALG
jgi:hypothetical protein